MKIIDREETIRYKLELDATEANELVKAGFLLPPEERGDADPITIWASCEEMNLLADNERFPAWLRENITRCHQRAHIHEFREFFTEAGKEVPRA